MVARKPASSLNNVIEALIFGAGLTIFVVYAFLNSWRSTLITALSLPTSVIAAFIAVWLCGFTLNFMTPAGPVAGHRRADRRRHRRAREHRPAHGTRRGPRDRGAQRHGRDRPGGGRHHLLHHGVFVPVAFMPGVAGEWFRPFALTVAASVMVSLFISFTLDPMLSAYWGDPPGYTNMPPWLAFTKLWPSMNGSTTRPTATAASSPGRCITACGWR
jgi:HAE1 family hydrophobic/amphiphilic exporter-1